jgi:Ca-activated chloride channel family protein
MALALVSLSILVLAQSPQQTPSGEVQKQDKGYVISVDTTLIQVPVSVHDRDGRPVNNLTKDQFQVFEDRVPQEIKLFVHEDVPISLGLVIDNSGSMRNKRERVNSAALSFVRESNPEDESFIVNFDDSAYLEQDFTSSIGDLMDALDNLDTRGETALYDAIYLSVDKVVKEGKRDTKALLLVTDGEDNSSKYKYDEVLKQLKESKVTLYAIGLLEENEQHSLFSAPPSKKAKAALQTFAEATGGVAYFPKSVDEVEELCKQIAHDLRNRYTLGYTPTNRNLDGSLRKVSVVVTPKGSTKLTTRYKTEYFAPKPDSSQQY